MPPLALDTTPSVHYTSSLGLEQEPDAYFKKPWSASKSSSLYNIPSWGAPYFIANKDGNMAVRPFGNDTKQNEEIDIMHSLQKATELDVLGKFCHPSPVIIRFPDILKDRLERIQSAFESGIKALHYENKFQGVYPVKCNQDRFVVEDIVGFGKPCNFGLEAGSKPELLLAMTSLCKGGPDALLICNGYKDVDYVCLALLAKKLLKRNCVIVLEQEEELDVVLSLSKKLCIEPLLGIRAKLNTRHAGHFGETSGENGKFGLSCWQIVNVVQKLQRWKMLHSLQLLHFHIGSQIPTLSVLNDGVSEATHVYSELSLMGASMHYLDIGGGLGIDYDGSSSAESDMSVSYTIEEYAMEVVLAVKGVCQIKGTKHPILCSESGRALVSHHSVLVFDVLSAEEKGRHRAGQEGITLELVDSTLPEEVCRFHQLLASSLRVMDYESASKYAKQMKFVSVDLFKHGKLSLMQLASVTSFCEVVATLAEEKSYEKALHNDTAACEKLMEESGYSYNAVYHINLSVFKSMPDTWAIGQLFPIVPLHRLEEEPTMRAILSDLTCDSDGKIARFVGSEGVGKRASYIRVHPFQKGQPYYMGMFLGGAYQEALGGMHNLFGAPPVLRVACANKKGRDSIAGDLEVIKVSDGQKICDVLGSMLYEPTTMVEDLLMEVHKWSQGGGACGEMPGGEEEILMRKLACSFLSSTYLTTNTLAGSVAYSML